MQLRAMRALVELLVSSVSLDPGIKLRANTGSLLVGPLPLLHAHSLRPRSLLRRRVLRSALQKARMARMAWDGFWRWASLGRV